MNYADYVTVGALLVVALAALSIETQLRAIRRLLEDQAILVSRRQEPAGAVPPASREAEAPV